jgi:hypothetical protein
MQQGNFIDVFLARHVSGTYARHQKHWMLSCSIRFSAPSFWMGCGLDSRCVGRVCGADGARHHPHQVGISSYFMRKMHGQTTLNIVIILLHVRTCKSQRYIHKNISYLS